MPESLRTGHHKGCEKAEKPPCACSCGGIEHGWPGALDIASDPSGDDLRRLDDEADRGWFDALRDTRKQGTRSRKPGAETIGGQTAAVKGFVADVIRWLIRDHDLTETTRKVGEPLRISRDRNPDDPNRRPTDEEEKDFVTNHVIPQLREEFGKPKMAAFQRQAVKVHFWCELLAQTAHALDQFRLRYEKAQHSVVKALTSDDNEMPDGWAELLNEYLDVVEKAAALVFDHLARLTTGGVSPKDTFRLIWPARVLAVLMCREVRRHRAVREYCVKPIVQHGTAEIRDRVKERLRQAFPLEWPGIETTTPATDA